MRVASACWQHTREQRLLCLRRLLDALAFQGHPLQPGLIIREDFPARPQYLPRALSLEDDRRLQEELRRTDSLYSNALLLARVTGIRIGECIHLPIDCLRHVAPEQWALHVPLGKLHTERLVPLLSAIAHEVTGTKWNGFLFFDGLPFNDTNGNLLSPQQDVQLGQEAAAEVERKMPVIRNAELDGYLNNVLGRLKQSPHASGFLYTIHAVADKNINAFSLPCGPVSFPDGTTQFGA